MGEIAEKGTVYKIKCSGNKKAYVGSTLNFQSRKRGHFYNLRKGNHHSKYLQRSYEKYGEDSIAFTVLALNIAEKDLLKAEEFFIKNIGPDFNSSSVSATRKGSKQSESCKMKVSRANTGKRRSEKSKTLISKSLLRNRRALGNKNRRKVTPEIRDRINELRAFGLGCRRIARIVGLNKTTILNVFNGRYNYG